MTRQMFDAVDASALPAGAPLYAGYIDGAYANVAQIRARFPHATVVDIAVFSSTNGGHVLDVENGDATPNEAPGWVQRRRAADVDPSVYCNSSTWPVVRSAFQAAGIAEPHYWIAQYDNDPTIPAGAVAKQYTDNGPYDSSSVADIWPGIDPQETDMPFTDADAVTLMNHRVEGAKMPDGYVPTVWEMLNGAKTSDTQLTALATSVNVLAKDADAAKAELDALRTTVASVLAAVQSILSAGNPTVAEVETAVSVELAKLGAAIGSVK